jgi:hypothetical protein
MAKIRIDSSFPEQAIRDALEEFWDATIVPDQAVGLGLSPGATLDSLTATDVLITMESVLGLKDQELPQTLVKSGGYESKEEFIEHLVGSIKACVS